MYINDRMRSGDDRVPGDVARTIAAEAEKIESLAGLIADGMEIVLSQAPTV